MTDKINAQISAFVDDELAHEECTLLIKRLCADSALQRRISRYAFIGDVIRGDHYAAPEHMGEQISMAIEANGLDHSLAGPYSSTQYSSGASSLWRRWLKPVSGVAVAATVAGVALFTLQQNTVSPPAALPSTSTAMVGGDSAATTLRPVDIPRFQLPEVRPASVMPQSRMDQYLLRHRGVATRVGGTTIMGVREIGSRKNGAQGVTHDQAKSIEASELDTAEASALKDVPQ